MAPKLGEAVELILDVIERAAKTNEEIRTAVRICAEHLLALAADVPAVTEVICDRGQPDMVATLAQPVVESEVAVVAAYSAQNTAEAQWGPTEPSLEDSGNSDSSDGLSEEVDVSALIERLLLKAEATRWAAVRFEGNTQQSKINLQYQRLIKRANDLQSALWMLSPDLSCPADIHDLHILAACYETAAETVAVAEFFAKQTKTPGDELKAGLALMAQAQSALRIAVQNVSSKTDYDQRLVFSILRTVLEERRIYISDGMKADHPVDPYEWAGIAGECHLLSDSFALKVKAERTRAKLFGKLKHKASQISSSTEQAADEWMSLMPVVDELVANGVPPSRIEFRDALLPIADRFPTAVETSQAFGLVLREIEQFRKQSAKPEMAVSSELPTKEVQKVKSLLAGKSLVVIGAEGRRKAKEALVRAFGVKELVWISTSEHESYLNFEPYVARNDVAVVLLLIRWTSHSFGNLKTVCDRYGKPLVRLPGGYGPNQVAAAILNQASLRLGS